MRPNRELYQSLHDEEKTNGIVRTPQKNGTRTDGKQDLNFAEEQTGTNTVGERSPSKHEKIQIHVRVQEVKCPEKRARIRSPLTAETN